MQQEPWTAEQRERFNQANRFQEESIPSYISGERRPDCTTIQKAAEAGCTEFLQWCAKNGYASEFTSTAAGYALRGGNLDTFHWLIASGLIQNYKESQPWLSEWRRAAEKLGVDMVLFDKSVV